MNRLAELRFDLGLSPEELGEAAKVDGSTIRALEEGTSKPQARTAKKLADYFTAQGIPITPSKLFSSADPDETRAAA